MNIKVIFLLICYINCEAYCSKFGQETMKKLKSILPGNSRQSPGLSSGEKALKILHNYEEQQQQIAIRNEEKKKEIGTKGHQSHEKLQKLLAKGKRFSTKNTKTVLSEDKQQLERMFSAAYDEEITTFAKEGIPIVPTVCKPDNEIDKKDICTFALGHCAVTSSGIVIADIKTQSEYKCAKKRLALPKNGNKGQIEIIKPTMLLLECPYVLVDKKKKTQKTGVLSLAEGAGPDAYFVFEGEKDVSFKWHLVFRKIGTTTFYTSVSAGAKQ